MASKPRITSRLIPIGDRAILVRFASSLDLAANQSALAFNAICREELEQDIIACSANLVSVILQYDPLKTSFDTLKGRIMLLMGPFTGASETDKKVTHQIDMQYGGEFGPNLTQVCEQLNCSEQSFIQKHSSKPLNALALGFSPGFLYLGLHDASLSVPRRTQVQEGVREGSILFAAGQSAITSRKIRTGWAVIGRTEFRNFHPDATNPITVEPGDLVQFNPVNAS